MRREDTLFLMYHGVIPDEEELESTTIVRESEFCRQLAYLKNTLGCLTVDEALARRRKSRRLQVVLTFDDGYANNYTKALPVLEKYEIPAIIYVSTRNIMERRLFWSDRIWIAAKKSGLSRIDLTGIAHPLNSYGLQGSGDDWQVRVHRLTEDLKRTDPSRREEITDSVIARFQETAGAKPFKIDVENNIFTPLTVEQLRNLSAHPLITIGSHSHCHSLLNQIPLAQAKESITRSREILEDVTGRRVEHFSFPNGNLTADVIGVLRDIGFKSAVTVPPGFFRSGVNPYRIPRMMVGAYMSINLFKAKLTGIFELGRRIGF